MSADLPARLTAARADPAAIVPLLRDATAAWEEAERVGASDRVRGGLARLAAQAAVGVLRLGLLDGRVHVALGAGPGLVAQARPFAGADAVTWVDAWYLARLADLRDVHEDLAGIRARLNGPAWAVAWAGVLAAVDDLLERGAPPADLGWRLGAAERLVPVEAPDRALLPVAAALLCGDDVPPLPATDPAWGVRAFRHLTSRRSP